MCKIRHSMTEGSPLFSFKTILNCFLLPKVLLKKSKKCAYNIFLSSVWKDTNLMVCILVPSATRLKMSLTSSSVYTQKFEFFHWLTKKWMRSRSENYKALRIPFYFRPEWPHLRSVNTGALYEKKSKTNGDHSRSIRRNRKSFHVTKQVHRLQRCNSRS